jgi:hypothetical protein
VADAPRSLRDQSTGLLGPLLLPLLTLSHARQAIAAADYRYCWAYPDLGWTRLSASPSKKQPQRDCRKEQITIPYGESTLRSMNGWKEVQVVQVTPCTPRLSSPDPDGQGGALHPAPADAL